MGGGYKPRDTPRGRLLRRNRELKPLGLRQCTSCRCEKPIVEFVGGLKYHTVTCESCYEAYRASKPKHKKTLLVEKNKALFARGFRFCSKCSDTKRVDAFPIWRGSPFGAVCKKCKASYWSGYVNIRVRNRNAALRESRPSAIAKKTRYYQEKLLACVNRVFRLLVRRCSFCGLDKHPSDFPRKDASGRLSSYCKSCSSKKTLARMKKNPEKRREAKRRYRRNRSKDPEWRKRMQKKAHRRLMGRVAAGDPAAIARRKAQVDRARNASFRQRALIAGVVYEKFTRSFIYDRDGGVCRYCGVSVPERGWHLEHMVPLSRGGGHVPDNVCVSCEACNTAKGTMTADEFMASLAAPASVSF